MSLIRRSGTSQKALMTIAAPNQSPASSSTSQGYSEQISDFSVDLGFRVSQKGTRLSVVYAHIS
jgi:hypothetical protein